MKQDYAKKIEIFMVKVEKAKTKNELRELHGKINKFVEKLPEDEKTLLKLGGSLMELQQRLIFRMSGKKIMF